MTSGKFYSALEGKLRKLRPSGNGYALACCPVHKGGRENNPSFSINLRNGSYHCFSCGIKGTFLDLQRLIGLSDKIEFEDPKEEHYDEELDEAVLGIFNQFCPKSLLEDGFTQETLKFHEVGFDTTEMRITFPIRDENGVLKAISGRTVLGDPIRYKVYSKNMLRGFCSEHYKARNKNYLWMLHAREIKDAPLVVTEGFKAAMWVRQCGIPNVVATMGTQVTNEQLRLLKVHSIRAIILFDMDDPGRVAAKSLAKTLLKLGVPAVVPIYNCKQPDGLKDSEVKDLILPYFEKYISGENK